jgi:hypothetical protein
VPSAGLHKFRIIMREDGLKLDQFVLTTDPSFSLATCDAPLTATPGSGPQLTVANDGQGNAVITWTGSAGCKLQSSATLGPSANWQDVANATSPYTAPATGNKFYRLVSP